MRKMGQQCDYEVKEQFYKYIDEQRNCMITRKDMCIANQEIKKMKDKHIAERLNLRRGWTEKMKEEQHNYMAVMVKFWAEQDVCFANISEATTKVWSAEKECEAVKKAPDHKEISLMHKLFAAVTELEDAERKLDDMDTEQDLVGATTSGKGILFLTEKLKTCSPAVTWSARVCLC